MLDAFRKTFHLVGRDISGRWVALVLGAIVTTLVEMIGAVMVFALLALVVDPGGQVDIPVLGNLRSFVPAQDDQTFLLTTAAVMGVFFVLRFVVQVGFSYVKQRLAHNAGARLATTLAQGYLRQPYAFHLRRSSAELVRNAQQTVDDLVRNAFLGTIEVLAQATVVVGLVLVMIAVTPMAALLAVAVMGPVALLLLKYVQPRLKRLGEVAQDARRDSLSLLQQSLYGIRDIKVLGREGFFSRLYRQRRQSLARALYLRGTVLEMPRLVIETSLVGFLLAFFAFSVASGVGAEEVLATLGLFGYAGLRIQPSLQKLLQGLNSVRFEGHAIDELANDLEAVEFATRDPEAGSEITFDRKLQVEDASLVYEGTDEAALRHVNLTIRPGEMIGICGPTGGGKTTLTDLLVGLLDPTDGRVTVDGLDLREHRDAWYRHLGVVPQMVFLVDDTLRRNVALGVPDDEIDEPAVIKSVRLAQLGEFVEGLPRGLDTVVGERGLRVSGGQRQRVAIARALYHGPDVLVFDEGTSALDTGTENVLMGSLEQLRGSRTIILVAHRLSTVRNCDRILYLEEGLVAAEGSYSELERSSPGFRSLTQG